MMNRTTRVARLGLLTALALILGWLEAQLPGLPALPGVKLGIANIVLLYVLLTDTAAAAFSLMVVRVSLSGLLYAGFSGFCYSLAGGLFSLGTMFLLRKISAVGTVGVSIGGAAAHNLGQLCVACFWIGHRGALAYAPMLLVAGIATGTLTGVSARLVMRAFRGGEGRGHR